MFKTTTPDVDIFFPVVERKCAWTDVRGVNHPVPNQKVLVRPIMHNTVVHGQPLAVVGKGYSLISMYEVVTALEQEMQTLLTPHDLEACFVKDSVARHGQTCMREYHFPHNARTIGRHGSVGLRIAVVNGYGGSSVKIIGGAIDFMCTNGLITGTFDTSYHRHTSGLKLEHVTAKLSQCINGFNDGVVRWRSWSRKEMPHEQAMGLLREIATSPRMFEHLSDQYLREVPVRGSNLWSVVSALTYFASHGVVKKTDNDTEALTRLSRGLFIDKVLRSATFHALENA